MLASPSQAWDAERFMLAANRMGPHTASEARALMAAMSELAGQDEDARLRGVNQFYNHRIVFRDDIEVWGQTDYWASPLEMLSKGQGDCEDYAIAKYFTLRKLGVPSDKLRITYVKAVRLKQAHMVLTYYPTPNAIPLVLDNLIDGIVSADKRNDLVPVYAFNAEGMWLPGAGGNKRVGDSKRLSRWVDLTKKMQAEGFPAESAQ